MIKNIKNYYCENCFNSDLEFVLIDDFGSVFCGENCKIQYIFERKKRLIQDQKEIENLK